MNDGKTIKVPIPPLDDERRREMAKKIKKMLEDEKTACGRVIDKSFVFFYSVIIMASGVRCHSVLNLCAVSFWWWAV